MKASTAFLMGLQHLFFLLLLHSAYLKSQLFSLFFGEAEWIHFQPVILL